MSMPDRGADAAGRVEPAPRLTVVMPVYNAEALLPECLTALRSSAGVDFEVLVVDDSSTDRSAAIAAEHGCTVIPSGGRLGPGRARNLGAGAARGDILFFVDSDVMVRPDTLARVAAAFDDPGIDGVIAVQAPAMRFRDVCSSYKNLWMYYTYVRRAGEDVPLFYTTAAAIRRRAFEDSGGFDVNYENPNIEDTDFGQKLARLGYKVRVLPEVEVEHVKGYDLAGLLRTDFLRSVSLARLKLRKSADGLTTNDTSVPTGYILSVPLAVLALVGVIVGMAGGWSGLVGASALAIGIVLVLNIPFLRLLYAHGGIRVGGLGCVVLIIELLAAGIGSAVGVATFFGGQRY